MKYTMLHVLEILNVKGNLNCVLFKSYDNFAWWAYLAYWWSCIWKGLRLQPAQQACLMANLYLQDTLWLICAESFQGYPSWFPYSIGGPYIHKYVTQIWYFLVYALLATFRLCFLMNFKDQVKGFTLLTCVPAAVARVLIFPSEKCVHITENYNTCSALIFQTWLSTNGVWKQICQESTIWACVCIYFVIYRTFFFKSYSKPTSIVVIGRRRKT